MDETYDVIIVGTGLTECILSGLLSVDGKKVLHVDRNDYYGGESTSLNLTKLFGKFRDGEAPPSALGADREWNVDLIPKFMMASGELVKVLTHTDVTRYLEFKQIAGSYVYANKVLSKVPSTGAEALSSPLVGMFEKRRLQKFLEYASQYNQDDPATHKNMDLTKTLMKDVYAHFGLEKATQGFVGHAMALYLNDDYLEQPAIEVQKRLVLYVTSMNRFGKSPYIYPLYGLGELPQGFARLSAIYGGTYMLDKKVDEVIYDAEGKFTGIRSGDEVAKATQIIGDPSYFEGKTRKTGRIVRCICLLRHPIPNTNDCDSSQIIIPQDQLNRKHDIYIASVSSAQNVALGGYYLATISTIAETDRPEQEIAPALELLGKIEDKFVTVSDLEEPLEDGTKDNVFISKSYDATSHFATVCDDVKNIYKRVTGTDLVLKQRPAQEE
ncbi:GDP dissociation inhibitor [Syncephalis fuscata]|nr:GDP dissociation inhibitor [Syncephalis fuscata]